MKFNLTREEMHDHLKVKKAALLSIAINVLEIIAGVVMMLLVRKVLLGGVEESIVRMVSLMCFTIVGWGALTDIGASLTSLLEVQARPVVAEEAKAYQQHGHKNAKDRAWWELRCMVRSLAVFCADEEMAEVMVSSGLLQFLKALTYHTEDSLCVQVCRVLSELSFQHNSVGVGMARRREA